MKYPFLFIAIIITVSLSSCSSSSDDMSETISEMESKINTSQKIDTIAVADLLSACQNSSAKYTTDSLSPEYLYKAAGLAIVLNRGVQAVSLYESVIHDFSHLKGFQIAILWKHSSMKIHWETSGRQMNCIKSF